MSTPELLAGMPHILAVVALVVGPTMFFIVLFTRVTRSSARAIEELEKRVAYLERQRASLRSERNELHARLANMTTVAANYAELLSAANGENAYLSEDLRRLAQRAPAGDNTAKDRRVEPAAPTPVEPAAPEEHPSRWELLEIDR
ncbi:MAG: hypothetical protein KDE24_17870 [Caldilinea sp.]|nr:hypothetical protein [Caldilinea sp.]